MITKKYYKLIRVSHDDEGYFYIKNVSNEVGEFTINIYTRGTMEYSLDGVNWTSYDLTTKPSVSVNPNSNIYLRGTNFINNAVNNSVINFTKDYTVGGNFMSLSNYSTMGSVTTIDSSNNTIQYAFKQQTHLVSAADLNFGNVTTIGQRGLYGIFEGCTSLTNVPDLSNVTTIGVYGLSNTFNNCTSLTTGPDLSNVTSIGSSCLDSALQNCYKLSTATAPNISDLTQNNVLYIWLNYAGTQATGTKVVNVPTGATILTNSPSGIPTGWTRVDY